MCGRAILNMRLAICVFVVAVSGPVWNSTIVRGEALCDYPADNAVILGGTIAYLGDDYISTSLIFVPGANAVEHVGYFSDNRDDVANRIEDANLGPPPYASIGGWEYIFLVGHPVAVPGAETLVRGTKYYWTVDETDDQGRVWAGDIWEFTILGFYAFGPSPRNEASFVSEDVLLSWLPGLVPDVSYLDHDVYMGTSWEDVNNAVYNLGNQPPEFVATRSDPNYQCSGLARGTKFYWRVDEVYGRLDFPPFGGGVYRKGDIWEFTTGVAGVFVDIDATGMNDGSTWADAFNHLQDALADVAVSGKDIWVAEGTYKPDKDTANRSGSGDRTATFQLINRVAIYGGYAGFGEPDPNARDIELYETILSGSIGMRGNGDNSYHVVASKGTNAMTILDGFTITGGNADGKGANMEGGGMHNMRKAKPTISNCTFHVNSAGNGGGMYNFDHSRPTVSNCVFSGNSANSDGGGMLNHSESDATVINCTFRGNSASNNGGGMFNYNNSAILTNCILWGNSDGGHTEESAQISNVGSTPLVNYCCVQGLTRRLGGTGNIGNDPLFVDPPDNLRLSAESRCIDTGNNSAVPSGVTTDLDGHPRIVNGDGDRTNVVDMGAYEFNWTYIGDFDNNRAIDLGDFAMFGRAFFSEPGDPEWNRLCDISIPADNFIDWLDLAVFVDNWLARAR